MRVGRERLARRTAGEESKRSCREPARDLLSGNQRDVLVYEDRIVVVLEGVFARSIDIVACANSDAGGLQAGGQPPSATEEIDSFYHGRYIVSFHIDGNSSRFRREDRAPSDNRFRQRIVHGPAAQGARKG